MRTRRSHVKDDESPAFRLECKCSPDATPVLKRVQASGRLDGVLFELTMRQTYRNTGARPLEVIYTFPLPHGAVLLGFAAELAGKRKQGVIVAKPESERRYETVSYTHLDVYKRQSGDCAAKVAGTGEAHRVCQT